MMSSLLKATWSITRLEKAWHVIRENARTSKSENVCKEVDDFEFEVSKNLRSLSARLSKHTFTFPAAKGVPIEKRTPDGRKTGKFRPIVLATVEARVVQRSM